MLVNDAINGTRKQIESNEVVYYTIETGGFLCIASMESDSTLLEVEVKFIPLASYTTISKEKLL